MNADPDPATQINADPCGSGYGSGFATLGLSNPLFSLPELLEEDPALAEDAQAAASIVRHQDIPCHTGFSLLKSRDILLTVLRIRDVYARIRIFLIPDPHQRI